MNKRVFVVEDDMHIRYSLEEILKVEGYDVESAENGQEALNKLREASPPGVILLDIMMPVMDGFKFREEQMKDDALALIPTVVMSANAHLHEKVTAMQGAAYLKKPIELQTLLDTVEHFCS